MIRPRWRKVIHDLFDNIPRTLLVVFSIAVGVFSIGVIAGAYVIIGNDMSAAYAANVPANVELRMGNFGDEVLTTVRNSREVGKAEARRVFNIRVRLPGRPGPGPVRRGARCRPSAWWHPARGLRQSHLTSRFPHRSGL